MKEIVLTQGQVALVDDADYEWLSQWKWYANKIGRTYYALRNGKREGPESKGFYQPKIRMHNLIMGFDGVDHVNNNGLDNQRHNLRKASFAENGRNKSKQLNCSSKYKGVYWGKIDKKWKGVLVCKEIHYHLGYFKIEEDAARAYDAKAIELFGEFANLNFPDEHPNYRQKDLDQTTTNEYTSTDTLTQ